MRNKEKIAYVIWRYGKEVNGGAEDAARAILEHLLPFYDIDVLCSCSRSYPWDNFFAPGEYNDNGIMVHKFPVVGYRDYDYLRQLKEKADNGDSSAEEMWLQEFGPYCPELITYLNENKDRYKAVLFMVYTSWLNYAGLKLNIKNKIFIPTGHDQEHIYKSIFKEVFKEPDAYIFYTQEEQKLVNRLFHVEDKPFVQGAYGLESPELSTTKLPKKYKKYKNYIVYVGRVAYTKTFEELTKYFIEFKKRNPGDLKLLIAGRTNNLYSVTHHDDIVHLGFVSDEEKYQLMANARFLVNPSRNESLSIVILESMTMGRPVLVNADCEVMKGQCIRSNAGLYYSNYAEFEACIKLMLENEALCDEMGKNGKRFVDDNYRWEDVVNRVRGLIETL